MPATRVPFGYCPRDLDASAGPVRVAPLPGLAETVSDLESSAGIHRDWIYSPPQVVHQMSGGQHTLPHPSRVFGLPKTHTIEHSQPDSREHVDFHVWMLSFFQGMRLTTTDAGFLDATPLKAGKLVDFIALNRLEPGINLAEAFWTTNRMEPRRARLLAAAVHALFLAHNPQHLQFEHFIYLYTALDACCALAASFQGLRHPPPHTTRIDWICQIFGITTPLWADPPASGKPEVAMIRNATLHEALFMDEPLGFALHGVGTNQNLTLEMEALLCRLIVALSGAAHLDYVRSPINTRMKFPLELI